MGIILPSQREETCLKDLTSGQVINSVFSPVLVTLSNENEEDFTQIETGNEDVEYGDTKTI